MGARGQMLPRQVAAGFQLPVSGLTVDLEQPTGFEELLLADLRPGDPMLVLTLLECLARTPVPVDWGTMTVTDIDNLIMRLRQQVLGQRISASVRCGAPECGSRVEISFDINSYLTHHRPHTGALRRRGWRASPMPAEPGWFLLETDGGASASFRLPSLSDQIAIMDHADAARILAMRCLKPADCGASLKNKIETAMALLAPPLAGSLDGSCPDCGTPIAVWFEARNYCLQELRHSSRFIFDDIDALAERYHWSEDAILKLPSARRAVYVERARQARLAS